MQEIQVRSLGQIPGSERSPGEGNGYPLQYSCLGNPMDRVAWQATVQWSFKESHATEHTGTACRHGTATYISQSVQSLSHVWLFSTPWTVAHQASLFVTNSQSLLKLSPSSQWCHPTISSSVIPFSSHLQSFPASGSFPMSQFFTSGGQNIGVSVSASVLAMTIQDWFPLELTGLISVRFQVIYITRGKFQEGISCPGRIASQRMLS